MKWFATIRMCIILAACLGTAACATPGAKTAGIYTRRNAPAAPTLESLPLEASVSQYGVTWTFAAPARVGRFVNGDYYVVGPVTIAAIDPAPRYGADITDDQLDSRETRRLKTGALARDSAIRNGSMLNPPARQQVAFDSGIHNWFRPKLAAKLPIDMKPGDSLVSTISLKIGEEVTTPYTGHRRGRTFVRAHADNSPVRTAAVLTCMAVPQPADAFRPAYCDTQNTVYLARNLKRELLPRLPRLTACSRGEGASRRRHAPNDPPRPENLPRMDMWVGVFQRPWVNTGFFSFEQPMENMPHYEQWIGQAMSMAGCMLVLDYPPAEKEPLLINVVQVGIDYWGAVKGGHLGWEGWGGHGSGRKFPIVFAGLMLGDEQMASPTRAFPKVNFGEDNQTMYGDCWTGARVCFAGHSGLHADGTIPRPKWGPYEHLHPSKWVNKGNQMNMQSEDYRRANSSSSWVGQALVIQLLGAREQWNHDAFFDYVDRWMYEDDTAFRREIHSRFNRSALINEAETWCHQGQAWEPFVTDMWFTYRTSPGMPPTDRWRGTAARGSAATGE